MRSFFDIPLVSTAMTILVVLFLVFGTRPLHAVNNTEISDQYYEKAQEFVDNGDVQSAIIELKNALQNNPEHVSARLLLGEIYVRVKNGPSAEKELTKVQERGLDPERVVVPLARAYLLQGKFHEVLDNIADQGFSTEVKANIMLARGQAHLGLGDTGSAAELIRQAAELRPENTLIRVGLARVLVAQHDLEAAEKEIDLGLSFDPQSVEALTVKGELRRLNRDMDAALKLFSQALDVSDDSFAALLGRSAVLIDLDRNDEAKVDLGKALAGFPRHPLANYLMALADARQKNFTEAKDRLISQGALLDGHLPSNFLLGALHFVAGEYEQAEKRLNTFRSAIPDHLAATKLMAATQMRKKQPQKAIEVLAPALDKGGAADVQFLSLLGSAYMQVGEYAKGTDYFQRAVDAAPDASAVRTQLALGRIATGEPAKAIEDLESVMELDPGASQAGILLTLTHLRNKDFDAAFGAAKKLRSAAPENPLFLNLMGAATLGLKNYDEARSLFEKALEIDADYFPAEMNLGQIDRFQGDFDAAKARFDSILARDTENLSALNALAQLALSQGETEEAIEWLERAGNAHPNAVPPRIRLVNLFIRMRRADRALAVARELDSIAHDNPKAVDALGRAQAASGQASSAVSTFRRLVSMVPKSAEVYHRLAAVLVAAGDLVKAEESLNRAIELDPDYLTALAALAELKFRDRRYEEALEISDRIREKRPDSAVPDALSANVRMRTGDFAGAVTDLESARTKSNNVTITRLLYTAYVKAGDQKAGLAVLENWVAENPDDEAMRISLASAYLDHEFYDKSIEEHERLLLDGVDDPIILNNLSWLYHKKGDPRSLEMSEKAYEAAPNAPEIVDTYGWILVKNGQIERGLEMLREASAQAPQISEIRYHLAVALAKNGEHEKARRELQDLLDSGAEFSGSSEARDLLRELTGG